MGPDEKPPPYAPGAYGPPPPGGPEAYGLPPPGGPGTYGPPPPGGVGVYGPPPPGGYPPRTFQGGAFIPPSDGQYQHQGPYPQHPEPYPPPYPPAPAPGMQPNYGTVVVPPHMLPPQAGVIQPTQVIGVQPAESIILVGGCPACRVGVLEDDFTCVGICLAIFLFPIGVLICLAMRQRRCPNCGASFG